MKLSIAILTLLTCACSRGLSHDEALRTVSRQQSLRPTDNVTVDAISSSAPNEAIVRATIAGETMNLKLRRFDTGWAWEFAETKSGGWIAVDEAVAQVREKRRTVAASEWAHQHKDAYASTAAAMNTLLIFTPTPKTGLNVDEWMKRRLQSAGFVERSHTLQDWQERAALLRNRQAVDAWGDEFLVSFDSEHNTIVLVSIGPDKTKDTGDDLIGLTKWRPVVEGGEMLWTRDNSWKLPEGLGDVVEKFTEKPWGTVEYSRVVNP